MNTISQIGQADTGRATVAPRAIAKSMSPAPSLPSLARAALADMGNDTASAVELLASQLENPAIRSALALDAIKAAAASAIGSVRAYERQAIEAGRQASKVIARAGAVDRSFMAWPLPFGGTLGDATADEVRRAVEHYRAASASMERRAEWLAKVADALPTGARVRDALTETQLAEWSKGQ